MFYLATYETGLWISADQGQTWQDGGMGALEVRSFAIVGGAR